MESETRVRGPAARYQVAGDQPDSKARQVAVEFITVIWRLSPYRAEKLLVHLAMADWSNLQGEFHPTYEEIAGKARITKSGAIGIVQSMIEDEEVVLLEQGCGRGNRNHYRFAEKYISAVQELTEKWAANRRRKGQPGTPFQKEKRVAQDDPLGEERVNEDDLSKVAQDDLLGGEKVNEDGKKGQRGISHIRNNRHVPSVGIPLGGEEASAPPFDNFDDPRAAMSLAIATVMGLPAVPDGDLAAPIHEAAAVFLAAGVTPSDVAEFEREFYQRKSRQGKQIILTLKILREDLPGWARYRRMQSRGGSAGSNRAPAAPDFESKPMRSRVGPWGRALSLLDLTVGSDAVAAWFEPLEYLGVEDSQVRLSCPDAVFRQWIEGNYSSQLADALREVGLGECSVMIFDNGGPK